MTTYAPGSARAVRWTPLSEDDLIARRLQAVMAFERARPVDEPVAAAGRSREMRLDAARRQDVLRREHAALAAHAPQALTSSGGSATGACRVVLAHRNAWFLGKLTDLLRDHGVEVVASVDNGADAVGAVVAEQPDLLLVEDSLAMVPGDQVVREVVQFSPATRVMAQVAYRDRIDELVDAGADAVVTRDVGPQEVAAALWGLVSA